MSSIDERIVEMQFDNNEFEKNINESIQSLEKLKKSLKIEESGDAFRNIQNASKDVNFDHISEGLDTLNKRFSTTGIIGMQVIQSLTQEAIRLGGQLMNAVTAPVKNDVIRGGWQRALNIQQAKFQLEGLKADVEAIMDDVDNAVSGTAYGLDEAALVASQLAASGIEAGEGIGQMGQALLAVSGMAAMTGRSYGEIGHIMTTIAGNGRLMGMQLTQLSTYGLNVAAELGKQLGKSEQEIRDMVSKGMIDFNTFATAMYDAYHTHAKNANKTLMGSISNVHAALKKIGQDFMNPLVENDGSLVHLVNTIRLAINEVRNLTRPFAENTWTPWIKGVIDGMDEMLNKFAFFRDVRPVEQMYNELEKAGLSAKKFREMLFYVARDEQGIEMLKPFATYEDFIDKYGNFRESLKEGWLTSDVIQSAISALNGETSEHTEQVAALNSEYETLRDLVASVWRGDWGNGAARYKAMTEAGLDYAKIQSLVNKCEHGRALTLEDLDEEMLESIGVTKEQAESYIELKKQADEAGVNIEKLLNDLYRPTMLQMLGTTIGNIIGGIIDFFHILRDAISEVFSGATYEGLYDFMYAIYQASFNFRMWNEETKEFTARGNGLKSIFKALFTIIKIVAKVIGGLISIGFKLIQVLWPIGDAIIVVIGAIAQFAGDILSFISSLGLMETIFSALGHVIDPIVNGFKSLSSTITNAFADRLSKISAFFKEVREALKGNDGVSEGAKRFAEALTVIKNVFDELMQAIGNAIEKVIESFSKFFETFKTHPEVERFINNLERLWTILSNFLDAKFDKLGETFKNIFGDNFNFSLDGLAEMLGNMLKPLNDFLDKIDAQTFDNMSQSAQNFIGFIQTMIDKTVELMGDLSDLGIKGIGEFFKEMDWGAAVDVASALSMVYMVYQMGAFIQKMPSVNVWASFKSIVANINNTFKSFRTMIITKTLLEIAAAIGAIGALIYFLGNMPEEKFNQGLKALTFIAALLFALAALYAFIKKKFMNLNTFNIGKKIKSFPSLMLSFLEISAALAIVLFAIKSIATMKDKSGLGIALLTIIAVIGIIIGSFVLLDGLNVKSLTKGAGSLIAFAVAIQLIAVALGILSLFKPEKVLAAAISMSVVVAVMGTMLILMSELPASGMLAAAGSMVILAAALAIIGLAIGTIATIAPAKKLANATGSIIGVLVMMGLALGILANLPASSGKYLAVGVGMLLMAAAITAVIPAFAALVALYTAVGDKAYAGIGILAGILAVFTIFGAVSGISIVAVGLFAMSAALLAFGAGAFLAAKAILTLGLALPALVAGLAVMGEIILEKWPEIIVAIMAIIAAIAVAISGSLPYLTKLMGDLLIGMGFALIDALPVGIKFVAIALTALVTFIVKAIPWLTETLVMALIVLINSLAEAIVDHGSELMAAIGNLLKSIIFLVWVALLELLDMLLGWIPGVHEGIEHAMADSESYFKENWMSDLDFESKGGEKGREWAKGFYGSAFDEAEKNGKVAGGFGAMPGYADKVSGNENSKTYKDSHPTGGFDARHIEPWPPKETVEESRKNADELNAIEQGAVENHKQNAAELKKTNEENANSGGLFSFFKVTDEQKGWIEEARQKYGEAGKENVKAAAEGTEQAAEENKEKLDIMTYVNQYAGNTEDGNAGTEKLKEFMKQYGIDATVDGFGEGAKEGLGEIDMDSIMNNSLFEGDASTFEISGFPDSAKYNLGKWTDGYKETSETEVKPVIKEESVSWAKEAENPDEWHGVGSNNMVGLINGMLSKNSEIMSTARTIANNAISAAKNALGQESPSKVFHQMGVYNDQGLINGMLSLSGKVGNASEEVANSAINGAQYAINRIQDIINSDIDISPTIRPVFDDSLLQNGINTMSIWGNGYALNLAGSVGSINLTQGQIFDDLNKRLDSRFEELSDRIDRISDRPFVANLTTTLDGREIAKGTATYTNEEMNRITRNNNRKAGRRG